MRDYLQLLADLNSELYLIELFYEPRLINLQDILKEWYFENTLDFLADFPRYLWIKLKQLICNKAS